MAFVPVHIDPSVPSTGPRSGNKLVPFIAMRVLHANCWLYEGCVSWTSHEYLLPLLYSHQNSFGDDWHRDWGNVLLWQYVFLQGGWRFRHRLRFCHSIRLQNGRWRIVTMCLHWSARQHPAVPKIVAVFQNYFPSFLISCTAGLLKPGHIPVSWRVLFHVSDQADTVKTGATV